MPSRRTPRRWSWLFLTLSAACLPGCGSSADTNHAPGPYHIPEGCNPLAHKGDCLLPYPTDYFMVNDAELPSGRRVELTEEAKVYTPVDHWEADPTSVYTADGFSHASPILAVFPEGVDPGGLIFFTGDVFESLTSTSTTSLLRADTGEPVLHFAELDPCAESDERRALVIRPLVRLENETRYIVAIHGLTGHDGELLKAPEGFRRIRDAQAARHEVLGPLAERYETDIFPVIEQFGLERDSLQLAWDFTTESQELVTRDLLAVRRQVIDYFSENEPQVSIDEVTDDYSELIYRRVEGNIQVPLYMEDAEPGARLHRDGAGKITRNGIAEFPFTMLIPRSVASRAPGSPPARVLQYGHGFFGARAKESEIGHLDDTLQRAGFVFIAADWWGMSEKDVFIVIDKIASAPSEIPVFTDRLHQGMANFIALAYAVKGPLASRPEIQVDDEPLYDPQELYFYGNSQGHILGGTYAALTPHVDRVVLGVGGAALTLMMFRARPFASFLGLIESYIPDPLDIQKFIAVSQSAFDRTDPITYAPYVLSDTYADGPAQRRVLMHCAIGDTQVPNLATHLHARALGLSHLEPVPRDIAGLEKVAAPFDGSALVEFDFGVDPLPEEACPPAEESGVHTTVRELEAAVDQIDLFCNPDGAIEATCDGICDPE